MVRIVSNIPNSTGEILNKDEMLQVGVITDTHGFKGEVKVYPTTDDVNRFDYLKKAYIDSKEGLIPVKVNAVRYFKQFVIVKFKGINNINDVEKYKKSPLLVTRDEAVPLEEGEYYIADVIGVDVITDEGDNIGKLKEVLQTGANDVYVVKGENKKEILIPAIEQCILDIDIEKREMKVHLLDGLV